jgi:hypothetical protein
MANHQASQHQHPAQPLRHNQFTESKPRVGSVVGAAINSIVDCVSRHIRTVFGGVKSADYPHSSVVIEDIIRNGGHKFCSAHASVVLSLGVGDALTHVL